MLVLTSLDGRKGHLEDEGITREGFGQMKSRLRRPEMNLIFKVLPKLRLAHAHTSRIPSPSLPSLPHGPNPGFSPPHTPTDSEGRHLSFLRAASDENKYKLLSSLQTRPVGFSRGNPWLLFRIDLGVSVANAQTANDICFPPLSAPTSNKERTLPSSALIKTWDRLKI